MKQFIFCAVVAMAMGVMAEITNTVKVTKFHQSYPYSGKATVEYTVGGTLPANAVAEFVINTDDASATFTQRNIVTGANTNVIDFASSFGGALLLTNASFAVTIMEGLGGVQLWENGPYWAECNVGASRPEEYGYYFWWGDTVGYKRVNDTWVASDGSSLDFSFEMGNALTCGKDIATLMDDGWITGINQMLMPTNDGGWTLVATTGGSLTPAHDAATAHLGAPWRMPTDAEFAALTNNCTTMWITTNGVNGRLVMGKGAYANRSIFLPAANYGHDSDLDSPGSGGYYWSSAPASGYSYVAWGLYCDAGSFRRNGIDRYHGLSVRPVRGFAQ